MGVQIGNHQLAHGAARFMCAAGMVGLKQRLFIDVLHSRDVNKQPLRPECAYYFLTHDMVCIGCGRECHK